VLGGEFGPRVQQAWSALRAQAADSDQQIRVPAIPCNDRVFDLTAVPVKSQRSGQDFGSVFLVVDVTRNHELAHLKDQFLSSISHELRTPLTNICAYAEILRHLTPSEMTEWPSSVRIIHEEGLHLSQLVDGVFDYLQLESGEARFNSRWSTWPRSCARRSPRPRAGQRRPASTSSCKCRRRHRRCWPTAGGCNRWPRSCSTTASSSRPPAAACAWWWAIATTAAYCASTLRTRRAHGPPARGVREVLPAVQPPDREALGAGLGLASCRAIVARLGGMIWCEDSPLGGAGFVVLLPPNGQPRVVPVETALAGMA